MVDADVDARQREQRTIDRSCVSAGIWGATWYWQTGDLRLTEDADSAGDRRRGGGRRQALQLPGKRTGGRTADGEAENARCICQVVGDGQVVRRLRWVATNVRRPRDRTDEFYHYSDGSPTVRSVKQWDGNRAVGRPKTDGGSLVRSENIAGGNGSSIELSHGRFVACHEINFHIKTWIKVIDFYEGLAFFLQFGVKIWGRLIRAVDLYAIIYGILTNNLYISSTFSIYLCKLFYCHAVHTRCVATSTTSKSAWKQEERLFYSTLKISMRVSMMLSTRCR